MKPGRKPVGQQKVNVPILYRVLAFGSVKLTHYLAFDALDDFCAFVKSTNYGISKTCQ